MKKKQIIISVIVLIVVAIISFYIGKKYNSGKSRKDAGLYMMNRGGFNEGGKGENNTRESGARNFQGTRGGANGLNMTSGEIINKDANAGSVTVKLKDGGSKIIFVNQNTKIQKIIDGGASDLSVGSQIMISGQANADGSINATSIQQRPSGI